VSGELTAGAVQTRIRQILKDAKSARGVRSSQETLAAMVKDLEHLAGNPPTHATVILFKPSGKYYTEESWRIPENAIGPWTMRRSPDWRCTDGWTVLVVEQEPWGYPQLLHWDEGPA
jgi:hypothetical protein